MTLANADYELKEDDAIAVLINEIYGGKSESEAQCYWGGLKNSKTLEAKFSEPWLQKSMKSDLYGGIWFIMSSKFEGKSEIEKHDDNCQSIWKSTSTMAILIIGCILIGFVLLKCGVCCYKCWTYDDDEMNEEVNDIIVEKKHPDFSSNSSKPKPLDSYQKAIIYQEPEVC